jgi:flavin reductase (DIM6/NTAB) family NADH-FMN oxidoreductase RutF
MSKIYFTHDQIQERPNTRYFTPDRHQIHYHFRPARPADLCITRDKELGVLNVSAGTIGPLTWNPYTMCLHINIKSSPHTYRNLEVGAHCVVALPGRDIADETWYTALPFLRGINEMEVAGLHECPSKWIDVPGVMECPVNFECIVEFKKDYYTHGIVFVRVLGASIDEKVLSMTREDVVRWYPTYEIDDTANEFGGSIERLGVMGDIFECPTFPIGGKGGWYSDFRPWMKELEAEGYIGAEELNTILTLTERYNALLPDINSEAFKPLHKFFTELSKLLVRANWPAISALVSDGARI